MMENDNVQTSSSTHTKNPTNTYTHKTRLTTTSNEYEDNSDNGIWKLYIALAFLGERRIVSMSED